MDNHTGEHTMNETKRLTRSTHDRMIGGVCGGLGEYFGIDPTLVRIAFALSMFFGGTGIVLYIVLWLVMPENA